jgi:uncharacterized membrane protein YraQ (UPF0718 family)
MERYFTNLWMILLELAPWLLLGGLFAGILHVLIPPGTIKKHLGQPGPGGLIKAALAGVPMPLCSCGVIPAGIGLYKQGASRGASVSFLVATPQTAVDSTLVSYAFFGWPFALFKLISSFFTGILAGWMSEKLGGRDAPAQAAAAPTTNGKEDWQERYPNGRAKMQGIWMFGVMDLLHMIYGWVVLGVLISAALTTFIPENYFADMPLASGFTGLLMALLISLPMYACSTASVPIAAGLVHAGLPAGAALVYLVAGPATNVATMGAIYRVFGGKVMAIYLGVIIASSLLCGALFDSVVSMTAMRVHDHGEHIHHQPLASLAAIFMIGLFIFFAWRDFLKPRAC